MSTLFKDKSTLEDIQRRFDSDVDRFSNLETGQAATIDAPLAMELITQAAVSASKNIRRVLDIGCGAGNNTIKLLQSLHHFDCESLWGQASRLISPCYKLVSWKPDPNGATTIPRRGGVLPALPKE